MRIRETGFKLTDEEIPIFSGWGEPCNREVYQPGDKQIIPQYGQWAMITRQLPPLEGRVDEHFSVGRIFYLEHLRDSDAQGFQPDGTYKLICHSLWGDVCLWPYEYSALPVETVIALWSLGEIEFHPTNIESGRLNEIVFYCRSRGISLADAAVMALGTFSGSVGWFEPRADLVGECEAMAAGVHRRLTCCLSRVSKSRMERCKGYDRH